MSVDKSQSYAYGFLKPQAIQKSGNTKVNIQKYLQKWMSTSQRCVYMALYIDWLVLSSVTFFFKVMVIIQLTISSLV